MTFFQCGLYRLESVGPGDEYVETFIAKEDGTNERVLHAKYRGFGTVGEFLMLRIAEKEVPCVLYAAGTVITADGVFDKKFSWTMLRRPWRSELDLYKEKFAAAERARLLSVEKEAAEAAAKEQAEKEAVQKEKEDKKKPEINAALFASMSQDEALTALSLATQRLEELTSGEKKQ